MSASSEQRASAGLRAARLAAACALLASACVRGGPDAEGPLLEQVQAEDLYRKGQGAARGGDYLRAEQYFAAALDRGHPESEVVPALLRVCVAADRISAALRYAEPYLDAHPDDWALRTVVATLYQAVGEEDAALAALEQVVREAPERPEPRYLLGLSYAGIGDRRAAIEAFERYLAMAPEGEHAREVRGRLASLRRSTGARSSVAGRPDVDVAGEVGEGGVIRPPAEARDPRPTDEAREGAAPAPGPGAPEPAATDAAAPQEGSPP